MAARDETRVRFIDGGEVRAALTVASAADALERALIDGVDPESEPSRMIVPMGSGQLVLMPGATRDRAAVKLITAGGDPRIQGICVAFDAKTLAPTAVLDAIALTVLRTTALSLLAARHLAPAQPRRLVIFGRGPQGVQHAEAFSAAFGIDDVELLGSETSFTEAGDAVSGADIVCCATTAREPLFDGTRVADHALVVAIGSHEPHVREIDEQLVRRSRVVVESRQSALREAGDLLLAGADPALMTTLAELVAGARLPADRPRLFKSTGMAWEDTAVTSAILDATTSHQADETS